MLTQCAHHHAFIIVLPFSDDLFAARDVNENIELTVEDLEKLKLQLKKKLDDYKEKMIKMKEAKEKTLEDNQKLKDVIKGMS